MIFTTKTMCDHAGPIMAMKNVLHIIFIMKEGNTTQKLS